MSKKKSHIQSKPSNLKKNILQWVAIGAVLAVLYLTGLHTPVVAGMQKMLLYTGLFNAQITDVEETDGRYLEEPDYNFRMIDPEGSEWHLRDTEGEVTFVNVWASWCPPCIAEMPTIETLYTEVSDHEDIRFVMLSVDEDPDEAIEFMESNEYTMPYQFPVSSIPEIIQGPVLPTTYVISKEGQIVYKKEGFADYSSSDFRGWLIELTNREI